MLEQLNWLDEPRVYGCGLESDMPEGIRLPKLLAIDRACDDRLVLWLEEVDDEGGPWNLERYRRSARGLGRMTGRWPEARVERNLGLGRRSLHYLFYGKMMNVDLPLLADDATWDDPAVREVTAADPKLREDLAWLAGAAPALLDRAEALPHGLAHGDASPTNLHEPGDGTVVAFDWSYGSLGPVGSDLGQLLAGRFDPGVAEPDDLPAIAETILDAFSGGLADEGYPAPSEEVRLAWATHLAVRSAFSAILVDRPGLGEADRADLIRRRAPLARYAVHLNRSVV